MRKNKYIYILLTILTLFSFNDIVKAVDADVFFGEKGNILSGTDIGKGVKCSTLNLENKWLKDPTNSYLSCLYYHDNTDGNCIIEQLSYDKYLNVEGNFSNLDSWSDKDKFLTYQLTDEDKKQYTNSTLASCPVMWYYKKDGYHPTKNLFGNTPEYHFSLKKAIETNVVALSMKNINTHKNENPNPTNKCSENWIDEAQKNNHNHSCLYYAYVDGQCVSSQLSYGFDYATNSFVTSNIQDKNDPKVAAWTGSNNSKYTVNMFGNSQVKDKIDKLGYVCPSKAYFKATEQRPNPSTSEIVYTYAISLNTIHGGTEMTLSKQNHPDDQGGIGITAHEDLSCEELLGDELIALIQDIVNITKVAIPILLIVFGTLDFGKAVFSSDENEMKKAQGKFIKRLIIAVAFFLIPVALKLILTIANNIWGNIDPTICGIEF